MRMSNSFSYLVKEGVHSLWLNRFMALASVLVLLFCLILTGGSYLVFRNIENAFDWADNQNVVIAYADGKCNQAQVDAIKTNLTKLGNVQSVKYMSKDDLLKRYQNNFPKGLLDDLEKDNPLQDAFILSFKDLKQFNSTIAQVKKVENVSYVEYNQNVAALLNSVQKTVLMICGVVIGILLIVSIFIISNTIKLTVYSRRLEIYIMRSVGATNAFIRLPFAVEGIVMGLLAGGFGYGIMYLAYTKVTQMFTLGGGLRLVPFTGVWQVLLIGFLAGGVLIGLLGSVISMGRYLHKEGSKAAH